MATEAKHTTHKAEEITAEDRVVQKTQEFWARNSKMVAYSIAAIIIIVGGILAYQNYFKAPAEEAANDAIWQAEKDFGRDSFALALNGTGNSIGFLKVISKHSGTKAANLAKFYAGACYLQLGDYKNAVKYLEDFSTSEPEAKMRATGLLGDANSELGNNDKAVDYYKKAAAVFPDDQYNSSEYLYRAAQLYDKMGKTQEALSTFRELKEKFPLSNHVASGEVDRYLGKLGDTTVDQ